MESLEWGSTQSRDSKMKSTSLISKGKNNVLQAFVIALGPSGLIERLRSIATTDYRTCPYPEASFLRQDWDGAAR